VPRIPLIDDLTDSQIPLGSNILVEFDPTSQWYNACLTIATGWLKQGGSLYYHDYSQPPDKIRLKLQRLGLQVDALEKQEKLRIYDWYTSQLGQKSKEKFAVPSMKVADLSIWILKDWMPSTPKSEVLEISDNTSAVARFNDEKVWVEYVLTRILPTSSLIKTIDLRGAMKGVHSDWAYKQLEGAHDRVIDFKVEELSGQWRNLISVRILRDVGFDGQWRQLRTLENLEVAIEK
jgi:KaiC/GvpD/RAD55 family RecA-like ATPase